MDLFGSFFIDFTERAVIIQVGVSGTPEQNSGHPTNPDAV